MQPTEVAVEEPKLHTCVRDLVALSTMPAWWIGRPPADIAASLRDLLISMLRADQVSVRLPDALLRVAAPGKTDPALRNGQSVGGAVHEQTSDVEALLERTTTLRRASLPIGLKGELGHVTVAAARQGFPEELELLLMQVAANQVAVALQHAELLARHEIAERMLGDRASQQAVVARLGLRAMREDSLDRILEDVVTAARDTLGVDHSAIMELTPDQRTLQLRAGSGWADVAPHAECGVGLETMPGRAALTSSPVIVEDMRHDARFVVPSFLHGQPVVSGASVVIHCPRGPFGVLCVHASRPRQFSDDDVHFLQAVANLLAAAVERLRTEAEREQLLARTEQAQAEAERASSAKSEFLGMMSHELRTPLNAIGGYAQLIEDGIRGPITAEQREDLGRIRRSQRHLLNVIENVLGFLKLGSGRVLYDIREVSVDEILFASEELTRPMMTAKGLHYEHHGTGCGLRVRADGAKLQQIIVNLLSNATKFTDPGGRVEVECAPDGQMAHVRVRDTGCGIPEDRLETVFVPFMQIDAPRRTHVEGTGLGLAISRDFAAGMGGHLFADSELGKGSVFTIVLPRAT